VWLADEKAMNALALFVNECIHIEWIDGSGDRKTDKWMKDRIMDELISIICLLKPDWLVDTDQQQPIWF